jgi:hypothetical protein
VRRARTDVLLRREADTMGFYTCVTLFAALAYHRDDAPPERGTLLTLIGVTTLGLAFAHWLATAISARLVRDPHGGHTVIEMFVAHHLLPVALAVSTGVVVALAPPDVRLLAGRLTAAALLALLVGVEAHDGGRTRAQRVRLAALAFICAAGIAVVKRYLW